MGRVAQVLYSVCVVSTCPTHTSARFVTSLDNSILNIRKQRSCFLIALAGGNSIECHRRTEIPAAQPVGKSVLHHLLWVAPLRQNHAWHGYVHSLILSDGRPNLFRPVYINVVQVPCSVELGVSSTREIPISSRIVTCIDENLSLKMGASSSLSSNSLSRHDCIATGHPRTHFVAFVDSVVR